MTYFDKEARERLSAFNARLKRNPFSDGQFQPPPETLALWDRLRGLGTRARQFLTTPFSEMNEGQPSPAERTAEFIGGLPERWQTGLAESQRQAMEMGERTPGMAQFKQFQETPVGKGIQIAAETPMIDIFPSPFAMVKKTPISQAAKALGVPGIGEAPKGKLPSEVPTGEVTKVTPKEPWMMTREEYLPGKTEELRHEFLMTTPKKAAIEAHAREVRMAVTRGEVVPPEVLKDYPDLVKSSGVTPEIPKAPTLEKITPETPKVEAKMPGEVVGGEPPKVPPAKTAVTPLEPAIPSEKFVMADLQPAKEVADIAFKPDKWRSLGNQPVINRITKLFNPAGVANKPAEQGRVLRYAMRDEGQQKTQAVMSHLWEVGDQKKVFGALDNEGRIAQGNLKGLTVNEVRTYPKRYADKLSDVQRDWIKRSDDIEQAKLDFLTRNGIEVNELSFEEGGRYAGRRVMVKIDSEGNIIGEGMVGAGAGRPGAKLASEKTRIFKTADEAIQEGYRYLPDDEALYLNVQGAYNRIADKQMSDWVLTKVPWRTTAAPQEVMLARDGAKLQRDKARQLVGALNRAVRGERVPASTITSIKSVYEVEGNILNEIIPKLQKGAPIADDVQKLTAHSKVLLKDAERDFYKAQLAVSKAREEATRLKFGEATVRAPAFQGKILTGAEAKETAKVLNKSFEPQFIEALNAVNKANAIQRYFALAGDASVFGIQLVGLPFFRPKVFGSAIKAFGKSFFDETFLPRFIARHKGLVDSNPNLLLSMGGKTEYTEAFARNGLLNPKAFRTPGERMAKSVALAAPRAVGKAGRTVLEPFQRAFEGALDVAGIELRKSLNSMAKTPQQVAELNQFINEFRGLTSSARIGVGTTQRGLETAAVLAPRYNRAIAGLLGDVVRGNLRGELARRAVGGLIFGGMMTVAAIDLANGKTWDEIAEHLNPESNDFVTWDIAGQKVGPGSKMRSLLKLFGNISRTVKEGKTDQLIELSMSNPLTRFVRGNLSGVAGTGIDLITGKNYIGDKTRDGMLSFSKAVLAENLIPIWLQSSLLEGGDVGQRLLRGGSEFAGGRAYPDPEIERINKALSDMIPKLGQPDIETLNKKLEKATSPERRAEIQKQGMTFTIGDLSSELSSAMKYMTLEDMPKDKFAPIAYAYKKAEKMINDFYNGVPIDKRDAYRVKNPELDAALFFWGRVEAVKTVEAMEIVRRMMSQYGIPESAIPGLSKKTTTGTQGFSGQKSRFTVPPRAKSRFTVPAR